MTSRKTSSATDIAEAADRYRRRWLIGRAGRGQRGGHEAVPAADRPERGVVELEERAGRLERGRPGVADVHDVRPLARGGRRQQPVEQVGPGHHLDVDLDAGLLLELVQLGLEDLLVRL